MEGTKTHTETKTSVSRRDDKVTVKTVETITTTKPGQKPEVKVNEKVEVYEGKDGLERLPKELRESLEETDKKPIDPSKINMKAADSSFEKKLLAENNKYRKIHHAKELKHDSDLTKYAKKLAEQMAEKDEMTVKLEKPVGTNISCLWSNDPEHKVNAEEIAKRWYDEEKNYNFKEEPTGPIKCGHFSQMVWKDSKTFGAAAVKSKTNKIYVVALYEPAGNYTNEFMKNVSESNAPVGPTISSPAVNKLQRKPQSDSSDSDSETETDGDISTPAKFTKFNEKAVKVHNKYRARHGLPGVKHNPEIAKFAQEWADKLAKDGTFSHRQPNKYGENIYTCYGGKTPGPHTACRDWYSEIKDHNFAVEPTSLGTGHFTQMVWKETTEVGMGMAKGKKGWVIVCNYNPPGNIRTTYLANVPPPK